MAIDQTPLQLVLNVIGITGLTSLALICRILRRDNEKLTGELEAYRNQATQPSAPPSAEDSALARVPAHDRDIRQYVARRRQDWLAI